MLLYLVFFNIIYKSKTPYNIVSTHRHDSFRVSGTFAVDSTDIDFDLLGQRHTVCCAGTGSSQRSSVTAEKTLCIPRK